MPDEKLHACLAALERAEQALLDMGDIAAVVHVTFAIDIFRAAHDFPERPLPPDLLLSRDGAPASNCPPA